MAVRMAKTVTMAMKMAATMAMTGCNNVAAMTTEKGATVA